MTEQLPRAPKVQRPSAHLQHALPADQSPLTNGNGRDKHGRIMSSEAAKAIRSLRKPKTVPLAIALHKDFQKHDKHRQDWQRLRLHELAQAHGWVSAAVGALVNSAAWHWAASEFANERGAVTGDLDNFLQATRFTAAARANELAAWDLGAREAAMRSRRDRDSGDSLSDLLTSIQTTTPKGDE